MYMYIDASTAHCMYMTLWEEVKGTMCHILFGVTVHTLTPWPGVLYSGTENLVPNTRLAPLEKRPGMFLHLIRGMNH